MNIVDEFKKEVEGRPEMAKKLAEGIMGDFNKVIVEDREMADLISSCGLAIADMNIITSEKTKEPLTLSFIKEKREAINDKDRMRIGAPTTLAIYTLLTMLETAGMIKIFTPAERKANKIWKDLKEGKLK